MSSQDALQIAALEVLVQASVAIEVTLEHEDLTPLQAVLARSREDAASAIRQLINVNPRMPDEILRLQNEARRYECLVGWLRDIMTDGKEAAEQLKVIYRDRAEEFRMHILSDDDDEHGARD